MQVVSVNFSVCVSGGPSGKGMRLSTKSFLNFHHKSKKYDIIPVTKPAFLRLTNVSKGGDGAVDYEKLYRSYYMQVYSYAVSLTRDRDLAEEITQNTFYKASVTRAGFEGRSDEVTWLCAIARNLYTDELRRRSRMADVNDMGELPSEENMEKAAADADMAFRIHLVLHHMEEPYKEVFQLRVFGELSFAQIAAIFGKNETWARVTYHRAKLKIQERMGESHE